MSGAPGVRKRPTRCSGRVVGGTIYRWADECDELTLGGRRAGRGGVSEGAKEKAMTAVHTNPLLLLQDYGQSIWLDYLRRSFIAGGELRRLVEEDGLRGVTSNPAIFEKAIAGSTDYAADLEAIERTRDQDA